MGTGRQGGTRSVRWLVAVQVGQFALIGVAALLIVGVATSVASRRVGTREAIVEARTNTLVLEESLIKPLVTPELLAGDPAARRALDDVVEANVVRGDLVRIKLWRADGTVLYSDEERLIGDRYPLGEDERAALRTGAIEAEVSDLGGPENRFEAEFDKLLEVYLPVQLDPDEEPLLLEAYYRYELVERNGSRLWRSFAPIAIASLVVLELIQIPIAWSLARRLRDRLREREELLRRAVEAGDAERRQIASDLHDGTVQDLTGVAFNLAAAARRSDAPDPVIEEAAEGVRNSIRQLRSLIVDIYPADLADTGLAPALAELLDRAAARGLAVDLDADGLGAEPVPDATARLVYRAAQEAVRNVLAHAEATSLRVRVARSPADGRVELEVADDGLGLDRDAPAEDGHLGLRTLRGLVEGAGGRLDVHAGEGGAGTVLRAEVPA